jgi:hypothetical protein
MALELCADPMPRGIRVVSARNVTTMSIDLGRGSMQRI